MDNLIETKGLNLSKQYIVLGLFKQKRYRVEANKGVIFSTIGRQHKELKPNILPNGYIQYGLDLGYNQRINIYAHHLVYLWCYGAYDPNLFIDHKNKQTDDNTIKNLRAITPTQNIEHVTHTGNKHVKPRQTEQNKQDMIKLFMQGVSFSDIAKQYNCSRYNVSVIIRNRLGNVSAFQYRTTANMPFSSI